MHRLVLVLLLGSLIGCGVPPTAAELPADQQPARTASAAPAATSNPTTTVAPSPTLLPSPTLAPAETVVAAATNTPTSDPPTLTITSAATDAPTSDALPTLTIAPASETPPINPTIPAAQGTGAIVKGTISYTATTVLPADAVLTLKLLMSGTPAVPGYELSPSIAEQRISPVGTGSIPFALEYDPTAITPELPYTVFVELSAGGRRYFTGGAEVITRSQPSDVAVTLLPVPTATAVTGTVRYPGDRQPPPGAVLSISLQKVVDGFALPQILGKQRISPVGASPISFTIPVDPSTLDPYVGYLVSAVLQAPGRLDWFGGTQRVLTWGNPITADLTLEPPTNTALLSGLVTLPDSAALPPDAVVTVYMMNEHRITQAGASPIPYAIEYSKDGFSPWSSYALYGSVRLHEKLLYTSPLIPLDPAAMPDTLDLSLQRPANLGTVRGTVRYSADQPLPPDAKLFVQLADMQTVHSDGGPVEVATQTIPLTGAQPLSFAIEYDPLTIREDVQYSILAEIRVGDKVLLPSSGFEQDVITRGNPTEIEVVLK